MGRNLPQEPILPDSLNAANFRNALQVVLRDLTRATNDAMDMRLWRSVTVAAAYSASTNDHVILCNQSAPLTVTLPDADDVIEKVFVVKDKAGNANTHNITIQWNAGSGAIDGGTSATISANYGYAMLYSDGTQYWVVG